MKMKAMKILGPFALALFLVLQASPTAAQLTAVQVEALLTCQETIKKDGAKFIKTKLKELEKCADALLALQLKLDNGLITQAEFDEQLAKEQEKCAKRFAKIKDASTDLVDGVLEACTSVESIIFDPSDPLGFQSLISIIESFVGSSLNIDTVAELAGLLCVGKELLVDLTAVLEVPRPFLDGFIDLFDLGLFLDPRCTTPVPLPITTLGRLLP